MVHWTRVWTRVRSPSSLAHLSSILVTLKPASLLRATRRPHQFWLEWKSTSLNLLTADVGLLVFSLATLEATLEDGLGSGLILVFGWISAFSLNIWAAAACLASF